MPRVTQTNLKRPKMEAMQNPREGKIYCLVLGKMSIQEKNNAIKWVAESTESIADKISTQNESPPPPETTKSKSEDEIFGEITMKMVSGIPECEEKYLLKLNWVNKTQGSMPLTSTKVTTSWNVHHHFLVLIWLCGMW